ncbi:MAG: MBL fold metallo-hydrolase [Ferrimicrobium sp.]
MTPIELCVLDLEAMSCDLTWLLLKAGRTIGSRAEKNWPAEWYPYTSRAVFVETLEGRLSWATRCPRDWKERRKPTGAQEFFPYDQVSESESASGYDGLFDGGHLQASCEGLEFQTVLGDKEILPGVTLFEPPGHAVGTMSMKVDLPQSGPVVLSSNAIYLGDSSGPPTSPAATVDDFSAWYSSVGKLRVVAEFSNARSIVGYDAAQLRSMKLAPTGYYE